MDDIDDILRENASIDFSLRRTWKIPGHLREPIVPDEADFILQLKDIKMKKCKRHYKLTSHITEQKIKKQIYNCCPVPLTCLKKYISSDKRNKLSDKSIKLELDMIVRAAVANMALQKCTYRKTGIAMTRKLVKEYTERFVAELMKTDGLLHFYKMKKQSEIIKEKICEKDFEIGTFIYVDNTLSVEKEVFTFNCPEHGASLGPTSLLLSALDIQQTRFSLILYWRLADMFGKYPILKI